MKVSTQSIKLQPLYKVDVGDDSMANAQANLQSPSKPPLMNVSYHLGTIILSDPYSQCPEDARCRYFKWDGRSQQFRSPACDYFWFFRELYLRKIPCETKVFATNLPRPNLMEPALRTYQKEALDAWLLHGRGIIVLPTGAGKTRIAIHAMAKLKVSTLCLVPTRVLLHQWREELQKFMVDQICGQLGDGLWRLGEVTIATYASFQKRGDQLGNKFKLLVIDEVHHFGGNSNDISLMMAAAPWRLGLSATPPDDPSQSTCLERLVGPLIFQRTLAEIPPQYLASYRIETLRVALTTHEYDEYQSAYQKFREQYLAYAKSCKNPSFGGFIKQSAHTRQMRQGLWNHRRAAALLAYPTAKQACLNQLLKQHHNEKILIFTRDVATAIRISREHLIPLVASEIAKCERQWILESFATGKLSIIVSCKVLNEGIDVPDASVAIIIGGTSDQRAYVQRIGRVLRPSPQKQAIVYDIYTANTYEERHSKSRNQAIG